MPAEDFVQDALSDLYAPYGDFHEEIKLNLPRCGHCDKQFHQMALKTLYTEDESQYDTFCEECIKECSHELWVNEDK